MLVVHQGVSVTGEKGEVCLTDGDFVVLSQHDVVGREVSVDNALLLVQVT